MISWFKSKAEIKSWDVLLRLTLIEILLRPAGPWTILPLILLLACAGLISTKVLRSPILWLGLFVLIALRIVNDWPVPDNHIYLLSYWCLLVFIAMQSPLSGITLQNGSRLLIGFAFLFAVLWKGVLSQDYRDGRFFRVTILTDERFSSTSLLIGGLTKEQLRENRQYLLPLPEGAELLHPPRLYEPPALKVFAQTATWGALILEGAVAVLFLAGIVRPTIWRHVALLAFCMITYPFAPVAGFGWLLLVLGLAQCDSNQHKLRAAYIVCYFLVLLFAEIPWAGAVLKWTSPS